MSGWRFWIDRGGTFTDIVAATPLGPTQVSKLLSTSSEYEDAAITGIRRMLGVPREPIPEGMIESVTMGTTVATNAMLERAGEPTLLVTTSGFADALRIGYQNRPHIFDLAIHRPEPFYQRVVEVDERVDVRGDVLLTPDPSRVLADLREARDGGCTSVAIVFMHGYRFPDHERTVAELARHAGFEQVSTSHDCSALIKLISRGDTTVVDAYLSPILQRYTRVLATEFPGVDLRFMQSNGGLAPARAFRGKDAILSGPAGGLIGAVQTGRTAGFRKVITFDMGGTSTDVAHYGGELERSLESEVAGVRLRAPMLEIHTVAAGGGSLCFFDGSRFRVGPDSAGAVPGPAAYGNGGPLTVTDCNVVLGLVQPDYSPSTFGPGQDAHLDAAASYARAAEAAAAIREATGDDRSPVEVAAGFRDIAVANMANAIKKVSVAKGHDVREYALNCFGGAGGQHACAVADELGISSIVVHPLAGVLSALGMSFADTRLLRESSVERSIAEVSPQELAALFDSMGAEAASELRSQGASGVVDIDEHADLKYFGSDAALRVPFDSTDVMLEAFATAHKRRFGFTMPERLVVVDAIAVEAIERVPEQSLSLALEPGPAARPVGRADIHMGGRTVAAPIHDRDRLKPGQVVAGPAIIAESIAATVVDEGWRGTVLEGGELLLERALLRPDHVAVGTDVDPVVLEVFNNLYMSIAERMGVTLQQTSRSVNIKERLDYSCAIFDAEGGLVANAPHIPVHLGSMGESVRAVIDAHRASMRAGDVFATNDPFHGGTHLPDITVVTPVFDEHSGITLFYVGSRGHHADVGGMTPGSMPPMSRTIHDEGVLLRSVRVVHAGVFDEAGVRGILAAGSYPARTPDQNINDLTAQIAANASGVAELQELVSRYGLPTVRAYMSHVQANAAESVRRVIDRLQDGSHVALTDDGAPIAVHVSVDRAARRVRVDFTGTGPQRPDNFNAPRSVTRAAVLYAFRCLVADDIPLNDGCLEPIDLVVPEKSMLDPEYPAAVVAGNVEVSQLVTDALLAALGASAASQGTMNNLTFGTDDFQYYETICGGTGGGPSFRGTDAVQSHMTNSRLTDPEVLELRHPVRVRRFAVRHTSAGAGRNPGGQGVERELEFLVPMRVSLLSGRRRQAPFGLAGGGPGQPGSAFLTHPDGSEEPIAATDSFPVEPGDRLTVVTPGGGGFGPAAQAPAQASTPILNRASS